jgi:L-ascorbate metabolism protein UlaG (beta-lactamase superfamily)
VHLRLIRHATLTVELGGKRLLVDPQLDPAGHREAIPGTPNPRPNPVVPLPAAPEAVADGVDIVVVTHRHGDHLDETAVATLDPGIPLLCQPPDADFLEALGFQDLRPVQDAGTLQGLSVARTDGRHGTGELGDALGPVSGFVLAAEGEPTLHVAGDTVWCEELSDALDAHRPDVVVVNAGGARFLEGDPITMTAEDVIAVAHHAPWATVVAVHLEAVNHCLETRAQLRAAVDAAGVGSRVRIPADGESVAPWAP